MLWGAKFKGNMRIKRFEICGTELIGKIQWLGWGICIYSNTANFWNFARRQECFKSHSRGETVWRGIFSRMFSDQRNYFFLVDFLFPTSTWSWVVTQGGDILTIVTHTHSALQPLGPADWFSFRQLPQFMAQGQREQNPKVSREPFVYHSAGMLHIRDVSRCHTCDNGHSTQLRAWQ